MANGVIFTNQGRKILLNRGFSSSPSYTIPTYFRIGTGTATPAVTDTVATMTPNQVAFDGGGYTKAFFAGYPLLDETSLQVTTRCFVSTLDGNGSTITEFGTQNADGSPLLCSRAVFTGVAKTNTVQLIFVEKDRIT